jgi:secreted trypsin-like serine protease
MKIFCLVALLSAVHGLPQLNLDPSIVSDVFGKSGAGGYSGVGISEILEEGNGVGENTEINSSEKLVDILPDDYKEPENQNLIDEATIHVDPTHTTCASLTADFGYTCVPYYQCRNGTIITDGSGLIDIRNGFGALDAEDSKCPGFLDVCCKDPDFVAPPLPPKPEEYKARCGKRNQQGLGVRIQGFTEGESQVGEWPHMCALLREETIVEETPEGYEGAPLESTTVNHFVCGASLIAPGALLTAGHCVQRFTDADILKVRCGEWDTQTEDEPYPHQDGYVSNFINHPGFKKSSLHNDVAVLFTTSDFTMERNVDTICLPDPEEIFVNEDCFATGWGKDEFGAEGQYQVILKEIGLPVIDNQQCQTSLQQTRLGQKFGLHNSFLCAGGQVGKDTCKGDGGSPLVCPSKQDPNRYIQAGVVAWGIGCGGATPGVYADIGQATCFIDHTMACNGIPAEATTESHFGYSQAACGNWIQKQIDNQIADIPAGTPDRIVPYIQQSIRNNWETWANATCTVSYEQPIQSTPLPSTTSTTTLKPVDLVDKVDIGDKFARRIFNSVSQTKDQEWE